MQIIPLTTQEAANSGFTHKFVIDWNDVKTLTSGTAASIYPGFNGSTTSPAGLAVLDSAWRVSTAFVFSPGTLTFQVGDGSDADRFVAASTDLKTEAFGTGVITTQPYVYNAADTIDITVTAGSGALTSVTAGELHLYFRMVPLDKLDR